MLRRRVLFICAHNAARSQMAEGYLRDRGGDRYEVYSAGARSSTVSRHAIQAMREIGIDISSQRSKSLDELKGIDVDLAVILCDEMKCMASDRYSAGESIHVCFSDPGEIVGSEEEIRAQFRTLREEIRDWIDEYFEMNTG